MSDESTFLLKIISPNGTVLEKPVSFVKLPGETGEIGVLPSHSPLLSTLKPGELIIRSNQKEEEHYFIAEGLVRVLETETLILTSYIESVKDIDVKRATEAKNRSEKRLQSKDQDIDQIRANKASARARWRIELFKPS
ncbi:MAG: ATP synthase F1 subunit epsilon [Candidatus Margulisbacteria bacterium]|nr:ATP synthase F1 subunit epsilon [Candidatus Margulisiibacteriota bacterium]